MLFYSIPYFWRKVCTKIRAEQRGFLSICKCAAVGAYLRDSPLFPHFPNARRRRGGCIFSMWKTIPPPTDNFRHLWVSFALYHYISGADAVDIPPQLSTACGKPGWKNCIRTVSHCIFRRTSVFQQQFSTACGFPVRILPRFSTTQGSEDAVLSFRRWDLRYLLTFLRLRDIIVVEYGQSA